MVKKVKKPAKSSQKNRTAAKEKGARVNVSGKTRNKPEAIKVKKKKKSEEELEAAPPMLLEKANDLPAQETQNGVALTEKLKELVRSYREIRFLDEFDRSGMYQVIVIER